MLPQFSFQQSGLGAKQKWYIWVVLFYLKFFYSPLPDNLSSITLWNRQCSKALIVIITAVGTIAYFIRVSCFSWMVLFIALVIHLILQVKKQKISKIKSLTLTIILKYKIKTITLVRMTIGHKFQSLSHVILNYLMY